jgi:hypothetical protein
VKLFTAAQRTKLLKNGAASARTGDGSAFRPVVKLFHPVGAGTWLLSELDPTDPDRAFGLCDLGFGTPELGYVSLTELQGVKKMGLGVERDLWFTADKTIAEYAAEARAAGRIIA